MTVKSETSDVGLKLLSRMKLIALTGALSALPITAAAAQQEPVQNPAVAPAAQQRPLPAPSVPLPGQQPVSVEPNAIPAAPAQPVPLPAPMWTGYDAQELLYFIRNVGAEGLNPADYEPNELVLAIVAGDPVRLSQVATDRFNRVSSDVALGHVRGDDRIDWHIPDPDLDNGRQDQLLRTALQQHRIGDTLRSLLPTHPQYAALKEALRITPPEETDEVERIRLNMDRWRWLPRDLGERYIIVNVPAYTAALVENGETISRHHAVAGKISTPTPQITATATGVILNPWWEVPSSIAKEVAGKRGYVAVKDDNGKVIRWRQPPGPRNALGQLKFVMPNPKAIYLHDTNAKSKFNSQIRAFSHGCIRTEHILDLAKILLAEGDTSGEWTAEKVQETLASGKSVKATFPEPLPVYIVYMSSAATVDGRIIDYRDIYKRDGSVIAALLETKAPKSAEDPEKSDKIAAR